MADKKIANKYNVIDIVYQPYQSGIGIPANRFMLISQDGMSCKVSEKEYAAAQINQLYNCAWTEP